MSLDTLTFCLTSTTHPDEWERMWAALAEIPGNQGDRCCLDPTTGETWQYCCTAHTEDGWVHYFRHRRHPQTGQRECLLVPAMLDHLTVTTAEIAS